MNGSGSAEVGHRTSVLGLRVPAAGEDSVALVAVKLTAAALSEQIGGGLLAELHAEAGGEPYTVYLDEERVAKGLSGNERAVVLAARLGQVDRAWLAALSGDVLVLGCDPCFDDADVPAAVVEAARRGGLLGEDAEVGR